MPSAPRVIAISPISGNVKVMRFAPMFTSLIRIRRPLWFANRPGKSSFWAKRSDPLKLTTITMR